VRVGVLELGARCHPHTALNPRRQNYTGAVKRRPDDWQRFRSRIGRRRRSGRWFDRQPVATGIDRGRNSDLGLAERIRPRSTIFRPARNPIAPFKVTAEPKDACIEDDRRQRDREGYPKCHHHHHSPRPYANKWLRGRQRFAGPNVCFSPVPVLSSHGTTRFRPRWLPPRDSWAPC
jgi:hypothetical protein